MQFDEDVLLIAGPTASGKTGLAIAAAQASGATIINADSMQVYRDLRVITARPDPAEETLAPHRLFGHVDGAKAYSVAQWLEDVARVVAEADGPKLVFAGGTGLYFNALTGGLSPIPEIGPEIREKWRRLSKTETGETLHARLRALDPATASQLQPADMQRIVRALEVFESTGRPITEWQKAGGSPFFGEDVRIRKLLLVPDRKALHERINQRFDAMVADGALKEVRDLLARNLDPALPVMKAIGVPQLREHLAGKLTIEEAIERAKAATRQYAKRQTTWFRNSFDDGWEHHAC